jgi:hypothetical protein
MPENIDKDQTYVGRLVNTEHSKHTKATPPQED